MVLSLPKFPAKDLLVSSTYLVMLFSVLVQGSDHAAASPASRDRGAKNLKPARPGGVYIGMRYSWLVAFLVLPLAACAPSEQQLADRTAVERSGVSSAIYDKWSTSDPAERLRRRRA